MPNSSKKAKSKADETKYLKGRYPIWDKFGTMDLQLGDLTFESDMRLTLHNRKPKAWSTAFNTVQLGEFMVPLKSLVKRNTRPQFFNLINQEGRFIGQILANFWLCRSQDPKKKKRDVGLDTMFKQEAEAFRREVEELCKVSLRFSILGIRNLIHEARRPKLTLRITNQEGAEPQEILIDEEWRRDAMAGGIEDKTTCPSFGQLATFKDVSLPREPLFWPYLTV